MPSLAVIAFGKWRYIIFYLSPDFTWPLDLRVTQLCLTHQSVNCGGHSLVEVEIWYILIFNVRKQIRMIILLQSVTMQFCRLFSHILYYKVRQRNFVRKFDKLYYKVGQVLQSVADFITKSVSYYKVWQLLQIERNTPPPSLSHPSADWVRTWTIPSMAM